MKLLYIQASPRVVRSHAKAIADAFVEAWRKFNPDDTVTQKNLFDMELPEFCGEAVDARYLVGAGLPVTDEQKNAWAAVKACADEFLSYDRYVIATPMWNYSLPYRLKHYLDLIVQPKITFMMEDEAYKQAAAQKKVAFFLARGGQYAEDSSIDFQRPYLKHIFSMIGLNNTHWVVMEPTIADREQVREMHTAKINEALQLAKEF